MKRLRRTLIATAALVALGAQAAGTVVQPAPDFMLKDAIGKSVVWLSISATEKASSDYLEPAKLMA